MQRIHSSPYESAHRFYLLNTDPATCHAVIEGDDALAAHLKVNVARPWTEFGIAPFQYVLNKITEDPSSQPWWSWLPIHSADNTLIGSCGYKGPAVEGVVEIGYEIAGAYRGQGLATEIANALIDRAFSFPDIHTVIAHTLAEENASVAVLKKCGFTFLEGIEDPEDGAIWKWQRARLT